MAKILKNRYFGRLRYLKDIDVYVAHLALLGNRKAEILIAADEGGGISATRLDRLARLLDHLKANDSTLHSFAYKKLKTLYKKWNHGKTIPEARFSKAMRFMGIDIPRDDASCLSYNDGGMFLEHSIEVRLDPQGRPKEATIAG